MYVQLPFDVKYNSKNEINLNFASNYKSEVLFSQLPFLAHPGQPVFEGKLDKFLDDKKGIQKFLLVIGDLNDSILQSLNLIVRDGKLNEGTSVRRLLDPKFPKM